MTIRRRTRRSEYRAQRVELAPEQLNQLALELGAQLRPRPRVGPTLKDFAPRFIAWARGERQKPSSIDSKESILRVHLVPRFGDRKLGDLVDADIRELKADLQDRSGKTVNCILTVLRKALRLAVKWKELDAMPVVIDQVAAVAPGFRFYDFDELEQLVAGAADVGLQHQVVVLLGANAGLRMGEMIGLEGRDVDLRRSLLHVQRSCWRGQLTSPKGGTGRTVNLTRQLDQVLRQLQLEPNRPVLQRDGGRFSHQVLRTMICQAQRAADLEQTNALHILRHTFCSHLAMRGAPLLAIKELAGHSSLQTTQRYMHLAESEKSRAMRLLEQRSTSSPQS